MGSFSHVLHWAQTVFGRLKRGGEGPAGRHGMRLVGGAESRLPQPESPIESYESGVGFWLSGEVDEHSKESWACAWSLQPD